MKRLFLTAALLAAALHFSFLTRTITAAPLPAKVKKPVVAPAVPVVCPGSHTLLWGSARAPMQLYPDGAYECVFQGTRWYGSWAYCPKNRIFTLHERTDASNAWLQWVVTFEANRLVGKTSCGTINAGVELGSTKKE